MNNNEQNKKVLLALSGGVDSSVALLILKNKGYDVTAAFMKNWSNDNENNQEMCNWKQDRLDALRISTQLDVPFITIDFEKEYRERVFKYMITEYSQARTPNPDVMCNKEIKFGLLLKYAQDNGFTHISTGHYARIQEITENNETIFYLLKGVDNNKDQSYFLSTLNQEQLSQIIFPIGDYEKSEIRLMAKENYLITAQKKDSQGICFVGKVDMKDFLKQEIKPEPGDIKLMDGTVIGQHQGVMYYTIGQRKGLGIGGGKPFYVVKRSLDSNTLWVTDDKNDPNLYQSKVIANNFHWIIPSLNCKEMNCYAKIRYRQNDQAVKVFFLDNDKIECIFKDPQWAVSSGQVIVFYDQDKCIASAIIE